MVQDETKKRKKRREILFVFFIGFLTKKSVERGIENNFQKIAKNVTITTAKASKNETAPSPKSDYKAEKFRGRGKPTELNKKTFVDWTTILGEDANIPENYNAFWERYRYLERENEKRIK